MTRIQPLHHPGRTARPVGVRPWTALIFACATSLLAVVASPARAADVRVFIAGASKAAIDRIAPDFSRATGDQLVVTFGTVGVMLDRILAGEQADLAILSAAAMAELTARRLVEPGELTDLGVVIAGMAVRQGSPVPDISTTERLVATLRNARSIAYADAARGATSGAHFERLLKQLGIDTEVRAKTTVMATGLAAVEGVAQGHYEIAVSQSSEIIPVPGAVFVGGFPPPAELKTAYVAGVIKGSDAGRRFMAFLRTGGAQKTLRDTGIAAN
jgi:molybdate transport system substrate-binding protein